MKRLLRTALALLALAGCTDSTEPRVATTVALSTGTISLDAIGATREVAATVADQDGEPMRGVPLTWSSSSGAVSVVGMAGDSANVTAVGNGEATVTVAAGSATADIVVVVAQAAGGAAKAAGDAQEGVAGEALPAPIVVRVSDRLGAPVAGVAVTFAVEQGGGTLSAATATTAADGTASTVWTVGTVAGAVNSLVATVSGVAGTMRYTASVTAAPAATLEVVGGAAQSAEVGTAVPIPPSVRVRDGFGNPVEGTIVEFAVMAGGGSLSGSVQTTDEAGLATVDAWLLGSPGENTLAATVRDSPAPAAVFTATAVAGAGAISLRVVRGNDQAAMIGTPVPTVPAVIVRDGAGNPIAGHSVTFAVTGGGGGAVTGGHTETDADGIATPDGWTLGPAAELNSLRVTAVGAEDPVTFDAAGCADTPGTPFGITVCVASTPSPAIRASLETAIARWQGIITADLPDLPVQMPAFACSRAIDLVVDDLLIFAELDVIDGEGRILGSAGPCILDSSPTGPRPVVGVMILDAADLAVLSPARRLELILHEMAHVLGIGTTWNTFELLQEPSSSGSALDTYYSGSNGITGFDAIGGTTYTLGRKVPVENSGASGTRNSHWRESVLMNELMTGFLGSSNPLSELTIRSLADLGYPVDPSRADFFFLPLAAQTYGAGRAPGIPLGDDLYDGPLHTLDASGRLRRIR